MTLEKNHVKNGVIDNKVCLIAGKITWIVREKLYKYICVFAVTQGMIVSRKWMEMVAEREGLIL